MTNESYIREIIRREADPFIEVDVDLDELTRLCMDDADTPKEEAPPELGNFVHIGNVTIDDISNPEQRKNLIDFYSGVAGGVNAILLGPRVDSDGIIGPPYTETLGQGFGVYVHVDNQIEPDSYDIRGDPVTLKEAQEMCGVVGYKLPLGDFCGDYSTNGPVHVGSIAMSHIRDNPEIARESYLGIGPDNVFVGGEITPEGDVMPITGETEEVALFAYAHAPEGTMTLKEAQRGHISDLAQFTLDNLCSTYELTRSFRAA